MHESDDLSQGEIEERTNKWKRVLADYDYSKDTGDEIQQTLHCQPDQFNLSQRRLSPKAS